MTIKLTLIAKRIARKRKAWADILGYSACSLIINNTMANGLNLTKQNFDNCAMPLLSAAKNFDDFTQMLNYTKSVTNCFPSYGTTLTILLLFILVLILIRTAIIASSWQAGPLQRLFGIKMVQKNGDPLKFLDALNYVLIEYLPLHILISIYAFIGLDNMDDTLLITQANTVALLFILIWFSPICFRLNGRNMAEWATGVTPVLRKKIYHKLEYRLTHKLPRTMMVLSSCILYIPYILLVILYTVLSVQAVRPIPQLHPEYHETFFGGYNPVWEDNAYFALTGFRAPAEVEDFYQYGRSWKYSQAKYFEEKKKLFNFPIRYPLPKAPTKKFTMTKYDNFLNVDATVKNKSHCALRAFDERNASKGSTCFTEDELLMITYNNPIAWQRYLQLPKFAENDIYEPIPVAITSLDNKHMSSLGFSWSLITLAEVHSSLLVKHMNTEYEHQAVQEWLGMMNLWRLATSSTKHNIDEIILTTAILDIYSTALEAMLYANPNLAKDYKTELLEMLAPEKWLHLKGASFHIQQTSSMEELYSFIPLFQNNYITNKNLICALQIRKILDVKVEDYTFSKEELSYPCPFWEEHSLVGILTNIFLTPGSFRRNITTVELNQKNHISTMAVELSERVKRMGINLRLLNVGVQALSSGQTPKTIKDYLQQTPQTLHNPITKKQFEWDPNKQAIVFAPTRKDDHTWFFRIN